MIEAGVTGVSVRLTNASVRFEDTEIQDVPVSMKRLRHCLTQRHAFAGKQPAVQQSGAASRLDEGLLYCEWRGIGITLFRSMVMDAAMQQSPRVFQQEKSERPQCSDTLFF